MSKRRKFISEEDLGKCVIKRSVLTKYRLYLQRPEKSYYLYRSGDDYFVSEVYYGETLMIDQETKTFYPDLIV